jgi:hypothetical protein
MQRPADRTPSCPRQSHLVLGALPTAVPCARLHARLVLAEWGLKESAETAELIVSELEAARIGVVCGGPACPEVRQAQVP